MAETKVQQDPDSGLSYRWRPADDPEALNFFLFHGLTGDEDVMWILESALPSGGLIAALRAPFPQPGDGYSWVRPEAGESFQVSAFAEGLEAAAGWVKSLLKKHEIALGRTVFVGFSQGSALCFLLASQGETCPAAVVSLAGFLPEGDVGQLDGLPVFWGHGTEDQVIPVARARQDMERIKQLGAQVHYCEAEVGHKVGVECMRGLKQWLRQNL